MLTVLLIIGLILMGFYIFLQKKQIKRFGDNLTSIMDEEPTNRLMNQELTSKEATLLVSAVNRLLSLNRKHARLYEKETEKLQQSLTHLSHDLRTPLAGLEGYLQLLFEAEDEEERKRYQRILQEKMTHTRHLMEQYFISMKYESEEEPFPLSPINPDELFLQCLFTFTTALEEKKWEPDIRLSDEKVLILGHTESFIRLCQNILQNVLIHGEDFLKAESYIQNGSYILELSNGCSMDHPLDLNRIYDRFYKGNPSRTIESTGLGLSIVKNLTHHLKGEVQITLVEGVFTVKLLFPVVSEEETKQ